MKLPESFTRVTPLSKILAIILFIAFPFAGFYLGMQYEKSIAPNLKEPQVSVVTHKPIQTPSPNSTADWKKYENSTLGISYKYPPQWFLPKRFPPNCVSVFSTNPENGGNLSGFTICVHDNPQNLSLKDWWIKEKFQGIESAYAKERKSSFFSIKVDGRNSLRLEPDAAPEDLTLTELFVDNITKIIEIQLVANINRSEEKIINDQILSTFKFLDELPLSPTLFPITKIENNHNCQSKNLGIILITLPDSNWNCSSEDYEGGGMIKVISDFFRISMWNGDAGRGLGCPGCLENIYYENDKFILRSYGTTDKILGIYGFYKKGNFKKTGELIFFDETVPIIEVYYKDLEINKVLTEKEKSELIQLLNSVSFEN